MEATILVEQEAKPLAPLSTRAALTEHRQVIFKGLPSGTYLVSCSTSDHRQSVTVSGIALYARLTPLSARETVSAIVEHSQGTLTVNISAPDKVSVDNLLVTVTAVTFSS
jgi:hypothetical protein